MPKYKITSGLPDAPASVTDKDYALLAPVYRAVNTLAQKLSSTTGNVIYSRTELAALSPLKQLQEDNSNTIYPAAGVALAYGQLVNLYVVGSTLTARLATSVPGSPLPAMAIVINPAGAGVTENVACRLLQGFCGGVSGTTVGMQYWLGAAGTMQASKPTTTGSLQQQVAIGLGGAGVQLNIPNTGTIV